MGVNHLAGDDHLPLPPWLEEKGHTNQSEQDWHLHERPHSRGQGLRRGHSKGGNGDGDGQLKVVARGGESLGHGKVVGKAEQVGEQERAKEHEGEIDQHGNGDPGHGANVGDDGASLGRKQDENGVKQAEKGERRESGHKLLLKPLPASDPDQPVADDNAHQEGDAQEDQHALRHVPEKEANVAVGAACASRDHINEQHGQGAVEQELEHRIDGDKDGTVFLRTMGEGVPEQHHGDAASQAHQDHSIPVLWEIRQGSPGQGHHQGGPNDPVESKRNEDLGPETPGPDDLPKLLIRDLAEDGKEHHNEANGNRD